MNGRIDKENRALIDLVVANPHGGESETVTVWIDTAFNGSLVLPNSAISSLGLPQQSSAEAILADGQMVDLDTFGCEFRWFEKTYVTQITANDSDFGLAGTMLFKGRCLKLDYRLGVVEIR